MNTFVGHEWNVKAAKGSGMDDVLHAWVVAPSEGLQRFEIK